MLTSIQDVSSSFHRRMFMSNIIHNIILLTVYVLYFFLVIIFYYPHEKLYDIEINVIFVIQSFREYIYII